MLKPLSDPLLLLLPLPLQPVMPATHLPRAEARQEKYAQVIAALEQKVQEQKQKTEGLTTQAATVGPRVAREHTTEAVQAELKVGLMLLLLLLLGIRLRPTPCPQLPMANLRFRTMGRKPDPKEQILPQLEWHGPK